MDGAIAGRFSARRTLDEKVYLQSGLLRIAHRNSWPTMLVQFAVSISVYLMARDHAPAGYEAWIIAVLAVSAFRLVVDIVLRRVLAARPEPSPARLKVWGLAHCCGLLVSAGLWAVLAWWRLPVEDTRVQFMIMIVLSALVGGASGVLSPLRITGRIYIVTLLAPACLRIVTAGQEQSVLGILGLVFMGVILGMHRNNHRILLRSIELGRENLALVDRLQAQNEEMAEINHTLEARVAKRTEELRASIVEAQAANRLKSEFLATISHEIRTPLNAVLGMAQVMEHGPLEVSQEIRLGIISNSANTLLRIFDDVLDISKIEAGTMEVAAAAFEIAPFLDDIAEGVGALARNKGLRFQMCVGPEVRGSLRGDEARLRQILSNLASNAVKFTERGEVRLDVSGAAGRLVFRVTDTGIGIAPEARSLIFERFVQADGSSTRRAGGLGMGLALSQGLAALMGGTLTLDSTADEGSTFTLMLPMPAARTHAARAQVSDDTRRDGGRVMVVDDNATNRLVLCTLLEQFGMNPHQVTNGEEAVAAWREADWDMILMDIHMPVMDGVDAARIIRAGEVGQPRPRTPIIAVTASAQPEDCALYHTAGIDDVVAKSVMAATLAAALTRQFDRAQAA